MYKPLIDRGSDVINKPEFIRIKHALENFTYTSLNYTEYDAISQFEILCENERLILLYGYNYESKRNEYHWASNAAEDLIDGIEDKEQNTLITSAPSEWIGKLKNIGFDLYAVWNEYFNSDISKTEYFLEPEYLTEDECEIASQVTLSCRGQSRGFTGQTHEWMKLWINGIEPGSIATGAQNCAAFVHRNNGRIVGIICTATYAHGSVKGPIAWVREVAVHPSFQRQGIARKLIMQALVYGKNHGAKRAFLMADECNEYAIRLYESLGFKANESKSGKQIDMIR